MAVIKNEKGKLPYGQYSKKGNTKYIITNIVVISLFLVIDIFFLDFHPLLNFIFIFIFVFSWMIIYSVISNEANKVINEFNKTANFELLESKILKMLQNNLHSETRKELLLRYIIIMWSYDKAKAFSTFITLDQPTNDFWRFLYDLKKLEHFTDNGDHDVALSILEELEEKYKNKKSFQKSLYFHKLVYYSTSQDLNYEKSVDKLTNIKTYNSVIYCNALMFYYKTRNNTEKAKEYASKILNYNLGIIEIENEAKKVLEME